MFSKIKKFPGFLKEVQSELKKVNWPTREGLMSATWIVIFASIILTSYIAGIDTILTKVMQHFLK